eukprot:Colp12_sorted_trinity150504_noHs@33392
MANCNFAITEPANPLIKTHDVVLKLRRYLDGDHWAVKDSWRQYIGGNDLFELKYDLSLEEKRKITFERAKHLMSHPMMLPLFKRQIKREEQALRQGWAITEILSFSDCAVSVKMGVMTFLFGGAILSLGSPEHQEKWVVPLAQLKFTGLFGMTEMNHGSNVRSIETTATYDRQSEEFIINTPHPGAQKMYIGNAMMGDYGVIFADLIVDGSSKGPHAFIVPIRNNHGMYPGVSATDLGEKGGLNGVDNGLINFDHVRIPRENLLNRFADVSKEGVYTTTIESDTQRFNAMLAALTGTRVALTYTSISALKVGLAIAVRYSTHRRQFGPKAQAEMVIMNYQSHQVRLMPVIATTLALTFATRHCGKLLERCLREYDETNREVQALCAGLKVYASWNTLHGLQTCRECTGGQGYLSENRLVGLRADADIFVTFEGDNVVLLQQVGKDLLAQYSRAYESGLFAGLASFVNNEIIASLKTSRFVWRAGSPTDSNYHLWAMEFKEVRNPTCNLCSMMCSPT